MRNRIRELECGKIERNHLTLLILTILTFGALFTWWTVARVEGGMRADLLHRTRLVAQAVDLERVRSLSGTVADIHSPVYLQFKEQFATARSTDPQCRFVYLMGQKPDGAVFFFVDDSPVGHLEEAPAGMIYQDAPEGIRRVFVTGIANTEGPYTDRWGTFISGAVPISDPGTGAVVAVLGLDINALTWKWDVVAKAALPVGLMFVLLISLVVVFISARRVDAFAEPVLRHLLPPLAFMVILLMAGAGALVWHHHHQRIAGNAASLDTQINRDLRMALNQQAGGLATTAQFIAADTNLQEALGNGHVDAVLSGWRPVFETLHQESKLTHFYVCDEKRKCMLCMHEWEKCGESIERFTILKAENTGKTAAGIELSPLGDFLLWVVHPIFDGPRVVGYVALGKEIEDVLKALHESAGCELAVIIRKESLNRQAWEENMRLLKRAADWDRLPRSALIYASQGRLFDAFASAENQDSAGQRGHGQKNREIAFDGKDFRISMLPIQDTSGVDVGDLVIMRDITADKRAFARLLSLGGTASGVMLALLLSFIYVLLRRTDTGIIARQAEKQKLQDQLLQAKKMESVGRLAGGVAHHFNNILMGIIGNTEMTMEATDPSKPSYTNLQEIFTGAQRAADLIRRLLTFARKQPISPNMLDLNALVSSRIATLQSLVGEDIELVWKPARNLRPVKMDPSQIEQILVTLADNARDAIAGIGILTFETENAVLDKTRWETHNGTIPGEHVVLTVSDTGCGMQKEILEHLFEPFHTTKEVGKGTGLGLAAIHGIVTQNDGFIDVFSLPGQGTTFKIHLPGLDTEKTAEIGPDRQKPFSITTSSPLQSV